MKLLPAMIASGFLLGATSALAEGSVDGVKGGPCATYATACKTDATVTAATAKQAHDSAMHKCVKKAANADAANGKQCLAWMESHHDRSMHDGGDTEKQ